MNIFQVLPVSVSAMVMIFLYFCLIISGVLFYFIIVQRRIRNIYLIGLAIFISIDFYILSKLLQYQNVSIFTILLFLIFYVCYLLYGIQVMNRKQKSKISRNSIKESADTLPVGLCFARSNGHPYLVNQKMNELSNRIRGRILQNAESFWTDLQNEDFVQGIQNVSSKKMPAVLLDDGSIWVFRRKQIYIDGKDVVELTAIDSTKFYELPRELRCENEELKRINQRLSEYEANVEELTKAQERLSMKVRIHDAIGQNLITTKYFLLQGEVQNDIQKILEKWQHSIAMLKQEVSKEEEATDSIKYLINAAQSAGVKIVLEGKVPGDKKVLEMIMAAGAEALTNLVRHTQIRTLKIRFEQQIYSEKIIFSNDGNHIHSIREGGGLSSLRKRVETMGGQMNIRMEEKFSLEIEIPQTERGDEI